MSVPTLVCGTVVSHMGTVPVVKTEDGQSIVVFDWGTPGVSRGTRVLLMPVITSGNEHWVIVTQEDQDD